MRHHNGPVPLSEIQNQAAVLEPFFESEQVPEDDRLMFAYYFMQAPVGSKPEWTWPKFDRGIASYGSYHSDDPTTNYDLDKVDFYGNILIPNYAKRAEGLTPMLDIAKPLAEDMAEKLKTGSLLVYSNHPTIVTPMLTARTVVEALKPEIPDIQQHVYITYGILPTVFEYDFGELGTVSPVGIASAVGNVVLTAAISDSNMQPDLQKHQEPFRNWYKGNIASLLSKPGNIVVVVLNGQRDVTFSTFNPKARRIHYPEGDMEVFVQEGVHGLNFAVYDQLLDNPDIKSLVEMYVEPRLRPVTKRVLLEANIFQSEILTPTFDGTPFHAERHGDMKIRVGDRAQKIKEYVGTRLSSFLA